MRRSAPGRTRSRLEAAPLLLAMAMADGGNQGPFGEKNFFIPNLHWPYGLSRARTCLTSALHFGHRGRSYSAHAVLVSQVTAR